MAQYDQSNEEFNEAIDNTDISDDTKEEIKSLFEGQEDVTLENYDPETYDPENPPDVLIVPEGQELTSDPGAAVVIWLGKADNVTFGSPLGDGDAMAADLGGAEGAGRVIVALSDDDQSMSFVGTGKFTVETGAGDDELTLEAGVSATMDTGYGFDTVNLSGNRADHTFNVDAKGNVIINGGQYVLKNAEVIQFDDHMSVVAANEDQAIVARMYKILFDRDPDSEGLQYWFDLLQSNSFGDGTHDMWDVTHVFMDSDEYKEMYGGKSDEEVLQQLYQGLRGAEPDQEGFNYWMDIIENWDNEGENVLVHVFYAFAYSDEASQLMGMDGSNYIISLYDDDVA